MGIFIRTEKPGDYNQIARVNALAFDNDQYIGEVALVNSIRMGKDYDHEMSLVAEEDGKIVGHVLFNAFTSYVNGSELKSMCLGPIAVLPDYQKQGIGRMLIEKGHEIGSEKGIHYSFLWGHDTYYPQFGYRTHMFGEYTMTVTPNEVQQENTLTFRGVKESDIPSFLTMWDDMYREIDLSIRPTDSIMDWISHYGHIRCKAIVDEEKVIGYIRYSGDNMSDIKMLLVKDQQATTKIINYLGGQSDTQSVKLPINSRLGLFESYTVDITQHVWGACMINVLDESCDSINQYMKEVKAGLRTPGNIILPTSYEMD